METLGLATYQFTRPAPRGSHRTPDAMDAIATSPSGHLDTLEWTLPIEGMGCASCVARVERALQKVQGVSEVKR